MVAADVTASVVVVRVVITQSVSHSRDALGVVTLAEIGRAVGVDQSIVINHLTARPYCGTHTIHTVNLLCTTVLLEQSVANLIYRFYPIVAGLNSARAGDAMATTCVYFVCHNLQRRVITVKTGFRCPEIRAHPHLPHVNYTHKYMREAKGKENRPSIQMVEVLGSKLTMVLTLPDLSPTAG